MTHSSTRPASASASRRHSLNQYLSLGACLLAGAGSATTADAAITFINLGSEVLFDTDPTGNAPAIRSFDLNGDGQFDIDFAHLSLATGAGAFVASADGGQLSAIAQTFSGFLYPARLNAGANIGAGQNFLALSPNPGSLAVGNGYPNSQWVSDPTPAFLGISFQHNGQQVFGWVQIAVAPSSGPTPRALTLINAAFEDSGGAITAGAIPEPSTSGGVLALGAAGLAWHRRARARRQVAA